LHSIFKGGGAACLAATLVAACGPAAVSDDESGAAGPAPACADGGMLQGQVFGGVEVVIDWHGSGLVCEGMPRPDGAGARLRFSGSAGQYGSLAVIVALPELARGERLRESPAKVTVIDEDNGRFYSNADFGNCWSDVERNALLADNRYAVEGIVYCVAPLAEINGSGEVSFTELVFKGLVDWADD
jgi:hypothetical protein